MPVPGNLRLSAIEGLLTNPRLAAERRRRRAALRLRRAQAICFLEQVRAFNLTDLPERWLRTQRGKCSIPRDDTSISGGPVSAVLTTLCRSLPVRVRNRCLTGTPKDTGVFSMGSQVECEQGENWARARNPAEFSGESANGGSGAELSRRPECSIFRPDWLPMGH